MNLRLIHLIPGQPSTKVQDRLIADMTSFYRYMKTKNMERLLAESRKRRSDQPMESTAPATDNSATRLAGDGLTSLVESIKRKSGSKGANGAKKAKKQKTA